jgi:hypothetical protein
LGVLHTSIVAHRSCETRSEWGASVVAARGRPAAAAGLSGAAAHRSAPTATKRPVLYMSLKIAPL